MIATIIGVLLGFGLSEGKSRLSSKKNINGLYAAIKAEIEYCNWIAMRFIEADIRAPLYRLPTDAYSSALPSLVAEAAISPNQQRAIQQFYLEVSSLNRGLDL